MTLPTFPRSRCSGRTIDNNRNARQTQTAKLKRARAMVAASIAVFLILTQVIAAVPPTARNISKSPQRSLPDVKVNRIQPVVESAPLMPVFSPDPSDAEITRARVFEEPLVKVHSPGVNAARGVEPSPLPGRSENSSLARAITGYLQRNQPEDVSSFTEFLNEYPQSSWRASLRTDLGVVYRRTGYFLRALEAWEEA